MSAAILSQFRKQLYALLYLYNRADSILVLANFQLWLARKMSQPELRPWERFAFRQRGDPPEGGVLFPAQVQQVFGRIIGQMGSPARRLQPRGKPLGRAKGQRLPARAHCEIIRKEGSQGH